MGKLKRESLAKKSNGILKLNVVVEKLQKSLLQAKKWGPRNNNNIGGTGQETVPDDVKEGHFAVIAADDEEEKRFVVPLECLGQPSFQRLLERAAEEYGFDHEGALMVPCRPSELEWVLTETRAADSGDDDVHRWSSYKNIVESY
uniref:auxin-responsive protein SAUR50-like n=1 Tax=Erigeron canadensis TaxID=72917 RepID=UPI001CB8B4F5|nr:auxin-responsive protein SAUR50-like [Erigeron canadensis]